MKTSSEGIALIKKFEGCRLTSYQDQAGVWTIGYGTTTAAGLGPVTKGQCITQEQADEWLITSLVKYENTVRGGCTVSPSQNQFDAMVSLCYNIGQPAFLRSSVLRKHNAKDFKGAADSFVLWNKAGGIVNRGLTRRRIFEEALYARSIVPVSDPVPTQSAVIVQPARPSLWQRLFRKA